MSARGRAPQGDNGFEFHPTPPRAVLALLESELVQLPGGIWMEPCAGTGSIVRAVNGYRRDVRWRLFELDERFRPHLEALVRPGIDKLAPFGDWVGLAWPPSWSLADVVIFNPPFTLTLPFLLAAMARGQWVVMLQRSNWFGSQGRAPWLREFCPDQLALPFRPSFKVVGRDTDNCEYSWFIWPPGDRRRREGRLAMLETPTQGQLQIAAPATEE